MEVCRITQEGTWRGDVVHGLILHSQGETRFKSNKRQDKLKYIQNVKEREHLPTMCKALGAIRVYGRCPPKTSVIKVGTFGGDDGVL